MAFCSTVRPQPGQTTSTPASCPAIAAKLAAARARGRGWAALGPARVVVWTVHAVGQFGHAWIEAFLDQLSDHGDKGGMGPRGPGPGHDQAKPLGLLLCLDVKV